MRRFVLTGMALLPLLLTFSHAAQSWSVEPPVQVFGFSSDEGGSGAYLGVDINDVTTERLSALKLKEEKGVEVTTVDQDAPAGKAGIKVHDVILTMNGTSVESKEQLKRMIHETPPGRLVSFGVSRDGQPVTIKLQLADRHNEFAHTKVKDFHYEMPAMPNLPDFDMPGINVVVVHSSARSGLMVENLTPQLGEFFGVKNGNGVLIRSVEKGSRADKAGFRAGDIIVKVNDQPVHDSSDFTHALRSRNGGAISVGVIRDKKEQNLNLNLPETKDSGEMMEESFDQPVIDADTYVDLSELQDQLAHLQPLMELASKESDEASDEAQKSLCRDQRHLRDREKKMHKDQQKMQRDLQKGQEKLKDEMEGLQEEVQGDLLEI